MDWTLYITDLKAHPERPWWRLKKCNTYWGRNLCWVRIHGGQPLALMISNDGPYPTLYHDFDLDDESLTSWFERNRGAKIEEVLAYVDRVMPRPQPPYVAGQVWLLPSGDTIVLTRVDGLTECPDDKPPKGSKLIAGIGAPWEACD